MEKLQKIVEKLIEITDCKNSNINLIEFVEKSIKGNYLFYADFYEINPEFSQPEYEMEVLRMNAKLIDYLRKL